jgi:hypothetical protein
MFFEFGLFWKGVLLMILSWVAFGIWGFEFTVVSLLTAILVATLKKNSYL